MQVSAKLLHFFGDTSLHLTWMLGFLGIASVEIEVFYILEKLLLHSLGCDCHLVVLVLVEVYQESGIVVLLVIQSLADILMVLDDSVQCL